MKNQDVIKAAIKSTEKYSPSQYKVFDLLIDIGNEQEVNASVKFIMERTNLTMPTVYAALKALQKDNVIIKNPNFSNTYDFNHEKLKQIIELYNNKNSIRRE